ncbi:hypothetical protein BDU57DRAFT_521310 [Ampelomyces quisqualis]|uniref:Uncharacterized protein n=1 Tax=Ampelomyces quisqualis TaxID=50730 RepID=A0A6A5QB73_AMPQU|nr:hypothetical protein BDU57DRAFT_521310 [Ampelomyces quisqualis]
MVRSSSIASPPLLFLLFFAVDCVRMGWVVGRARAPVPKPLTRIVVVASLTILAKHRVILKAYIEMGS